MNILGDRSIPFSTYAKILVDVATAAGQKGGQAFFKNAAQVAIQNALGTLDALELPVTIDNCYYLVTDMVEMEKRVKELVEIAKPEHRHLLDYYREFVKQPPEQLGGIRSTVFNYLQPYTTPDLAEVFCSADPTFDIKEIDEGRLITIKIPQKYQVEKKYISLLLKVQFYESLGFETSGNKYVHGFNSNPELPMAIENAAVGYAGLLGMLFYHEAALSIPPDRLFDGMSNRPEEWSVEDKATVEMAGVGRKREAFDIAINLIRENRASLVEYSDTIANLFLKEPCETTFFTLKTLHYSSPEINVFRF